MRVARLSFAPNSSRPSRFTRVSRAWSLMKWSKRLRSPRRILKMLSACPSATTSTKWARRFGSGPRSSTTLPTRATSATSLHVASPLGRTDWFRQSLAQIIRDVLHANVRAGFFETGFDLQHVTGVAGDDDLHAGFEDVLDF